MNPIQRLWLRILRIPGRFINDNLALRPGFLGTLGKMLRIGSRQHSSHTTSKVFKYFNAHLVDYIGYFFGKELYAKTVHGKANYQSGYMAMARWSYLVTGLCFITMPFIFIGFDYERKNFLFYFCRFYDLFARKTDFLIVLENIFVS